MIYRREGDDLFGDLPMSPPTIRPNRPTPRRKHAIKSDMSWVKHWRLKQVVGSQIGALRKAKPEARIVIVDANAGDGTGVVLPQLDLFRPAFSKSTAELAVELAAEHGCAVALCETNQKRREQLIARFPSVPLYRDNSDIRYIAKDFDYVVIISDPCGPSGHNIGALIEVSRRQACDLIIVVSITALDRIHSERNPDANLLARERYPKWMYDPLEWRSRLGRRHVSATDPFRATSGFTYRIIVAADYLGKGSVADPFKQLR